MPIDHELSSSNLARARRPYCPCCENGRINPGWPFKTCNECDYQSPDPDVDLQLSALARAHRPGDPVPAEVRRTLGDDLSFWEFLLRLAKNDEL